LTIWHYILSILSAELTKTHSFRLFSRRFAHWISTSEKTSKLLFLLFE